MVAIDCRELVDRLRGHPQRQPEVEDLGSAFPCDDDVRALEIAVNDATGMSERHRVGDLAAVLEHGLEREAVLRDQLAQRPAVDVLHHDEGVPVDFADFVNGADVRMIQRGGGARFFEQLRPGHLRRPRSVTA